MKRVLYALIVAGWPLSSAHASGPNTIGLFLYLIVIFTTLSFVSIIVVFAVFAMRKRYAARAPRTDLQKRREETIWVVAGAIGGVSVVVFLVFSLMKPSQIAVKDPPLIVNCKGLRPGVTRDELLAALGRPERVEERNGQAVFHFAVPASVRGPVNAEIDASSDRVVDLWCGDEFEPEWRTGPEKGSGAAKSHQGGVR